MSISKPPFYDPETTELKLPESASVESDTAVREFSLKPFFLALLILLLLGILGALLWWGWLMTQPITNTSALNVAERPTAEENNEPESTTAEAQFETLRAVSPSDELSAIKADLAATDVKNLTPELPIIDRILGR